ncbi:SCO family protein [Vibrio ostreicida]|uniref:SCO family protein n=1 Tax=Vibrio ostreicida TaxID=526588 RepID=A0ABT8C0I2_9VIBR|nr:SCO family protein [Vibrio ostreicida]MDN3612124.1 SCO family protein [Vibrio ostreicida]NPD08524.1 SCO family protein [Vibrio ostreicida]
MNKRWSLILVAAFALGFGIKAYLNTDAPTTVPLQTSKKTILFGENGKSVEIFDKTDPRVRIVYFGFTRCPDVCPTSLAMLAGALNQVNDEVKSAFRPVFISLDPERDAAADSYQYAQYFHPQIEGLSAPLDITTPLAHKYGVIFRKTKLENSELKYTLDHSSYFYFLKPDGTLITKVPHTLTPAPLVEAMKTIKSQGKTS